MMKFRGSVKDGHMLETMQEESVELRMHHHVSGQHQVALTR